MTEESAWLVPLTAAPGAVTLVCAPYAGARPGVFGPLAKAFGDVNVLAVQLPGHGRRMRERPLTRVADIIAGLAPAVARAVTGKFVLFGHSMGALVALELARALQETGPEPDHVIVSASKAPSDLGRDRAWHTLPDDELARELVALGAEPAAFEIAELREFAMPMLRADLEAVATFDTTPRTPLRCPITAVAGTEDDEFPPRLLAGWERETAKGLRARTVAGGHFLLEERLADMVDVVRDVLEDG